MSFNQRAFQSIHSFLNSMSITAPIGTTSDTKGSQPQRQAQAQAQAQGVGPSTAGFQEKDNLLGQLNAIFTSQQSQDEKNRNLDTFFKLVTGSTGGFAGVTGFARSMARLYGEPVSKGSAYTNLLQLQAQINMSNIFQVILVSELCPTEYISHPLAVLAMQAKMGEEFEKRFAMLATHISFDLFLKDYNLLQDTLADLEYKILLANFTSDSDPHYAYAHIGEVGVREGGKQNALTINTVEEITEFSEIYSLIAENEAAALATLESGREEEDEGEEKEKEEVSFFASAANDISKKITQFQDWLTGGKAENKAASVSISSNIENFLLKST